MRRVLLFVAATAAIAGTVYAGANDNSLCQGTCPEGTRLSNIEVTEYSQASAQNGTFVYVTEECEAYCEPVIPCILPNVPVVDSNGFRCEPLIGLSDFEPIDQIDFTFATSWDESQAAVP